MVELRPKTAKTYSDTYLTLLAHARTLKEGNLNQSTETDRVEFQQQVAEGFSDEKEAMLKLKADLASGTVSSAFTPGQYSSVPATEISFTPEGNLLHVIERSESKDFMRGQVAYRTFTVNTIEQTIGDIQEQFFAAPKAAAPDAKSRAAVQELVSEMTNFGFTARGKFSQS